MVERFALSAKTFAQPGNLLSYEALSLDFGSEFLHRQFAILRLQVDDKSAHGDRIAVGNHDLPVILVELKGMTALTMLDESDGLIEAALGIRLMAIVTFEFPSVYRRDICGEMALMIKLQDVGVAGLIAFKLKLWMTIRERGKGLGITIGRPVQFQHYLPRRVRMTLEVMPIDVFT